jgi:Uma2 family endonuclease
VVPDLIAEVVSPWDRSEDVHAKVQEYLDAGVRLIWVVHPSTRTVAEYRSQHQIRVLNEDGQLDGFDVVPGFRAPIKALFE